MKVYNTSLFKLYYKDFEGNWDYYVSKTPLPFDTIDGVLQLTYQERNAILDILEQGNGISAINLGNKTFGFEHVGDMDAERKYRLIVARFEDISTDLVQEKIESQKEKRKNLFIKNMTKEKKDED